MDSRIKQLIALFPSLNIDALFISKAVNITYLTQFYAEESWLLICPKKVFYITDFRYILEAQNALKGITVKRYTKSVYDTLYELSLAMRIKRIGFDANHCTLAQYHKLRRGCPKRIRLVETNKIVENLREVKDINEVKKIKEALKIHQQAHNFLKRNVKPNISEKEVLFRLEKFVKSRGVAFSFNPIVASGPNSCYPHAKVTDRKIRNNELVLIDMGIDKHGYKSDLTRMFFLGKISKLIREVNVLLQEAQRKAIEKIKAGTPVAEVDRAARNYLAKHKLEKYFGHALGHGVGLEIHESPRLSQENSSILKEGMVVTIEPAVYIPNKFGIRIEDMILVTNKGCEILSDDIH